MVLLISVSTSLLASMSLDRAIIYFEPGGWQKQDVIVSNPDNETLYLETEVFRIENPGRENEQRLPITVPEDMKLLATPHKSSIVPGSQRRVRLFNREKKLTEEKVYRVLFKPVVGPIKHQLQVVKLLVAYEVLVFIRPEKPVFKVATRQHGKTLEITNVGNSNVVLREGVQCKKKSDLAERKQCKSVWQSKRVYAGQSWQVDIPDEGNIYFTVFDGKNEKEQVAEIKVLKPSSTKNITQI